MLYVMLFSLYVNGNQTGCNEAWYVAQQKLMETCQYITIKGHLVMIMLN